MLINVPDICLIYEMHIQYIMCCMFSIYVVFVEYICGGSEKRGKSLPQLFNYFLYRK